MLQRYAAATLVGQHHAASVRYAGVQTTGARPGLDGKHRPRTTSVALLSIRSLSEIVHNASGLPITKHGSPQLIKAWQPARWQL